MKRFKNTRFIFLFLALSLTQTVRSQSCLSLYPVPFYDCVSGLANTSYTLSGGNAPYSYTIVQAGTPTVAVGNGVVTALIGTLQPLGIGSYTIFMTDPSGCSTQQQYQISANLLASGSTATITTTNVTCFGANNGSASVIPPTSFNANPGYTWSPGPAPNTSTITNLIAGMAYTVTIRDSKGCETKSVVTVTEPPAVNSTLTSTYITCFGGVLNTAVTTTGNVGVTSYSINGSAILGNNAVNLAAGTHVITTRDSRPCSQTNTVLVTQGPQPIINFSFKNSPTCPKGSDGSMVAAPLATPPLQLTWQPGGGAGFSQNNIPAGTYTVTLTYGSSPSVCVTTSVTTLAPAVSPTISYLTQSENCSAADGAYTINVSGVNPPFSYTTIPTGAPNASIVTGLSSGVYSVVTAFKNICRDTSLVNIGNLSNVSISVQNSTAVRCNSICDASVSLNILNAVGAVTYCAIGTFTGTSNTFTNLCAGSYVLRAVDSNGCPATTSINLIAPPPLTYSATGPSSVCVGKQANLQAGALGGTGNYTYIWKPGNIQGQIINMTPTTTTVYSLTTYDSNGCSNGEKTVVVTVAPQLSINITPAGSGICPGSTAQITPTITGGDGVYSFNWLPGNSVAPSIYVQNITIPVYTLTVNDGCGSPSAVKNIPINLFPQIKPLFSSKTTKGCVPFCMRFINVTPKSSSPQWGFGDKPGLNTGDTANYCYLTSGRYDLTLSVIDSNLCRSFYTYTNAIEVRPSPSADFVTNDYTLTLYSADNIDFRNSTANAISYQWYMDDNYLDNTHDMRYSFADTGSYRVRLIATNANNCSDTTDKTVVVRDVFTFYMPNSFTPNGNGINDSLAPKGAGWQEKGYVFEVFDRWGNKIFGTTNTKMGWGGDESGSETPHNLYVWRAVVVDLKNKEHRFAGSVTLVR